MTYNRFLILTLGGVMTMVVCHVLSSNRRLDDVVLSPTRYMPPRQARYHGDWGLDFQVSGALLRDMGLPWSTFLTLDRKSVRNFVFATAASHNHFRESVDAVASVQEYFPGSKILYYDLGLEDKDITQVRSWCNVDVRKFDFSRFPPHVATIKTYAFKPLIVQEILSSHDGLLWFDASVRFRSSNLTSLLTQVVRNGGISLVRQTGHSNHVVTHPGMYAFLPTNEGVQRRTMQGGATTFMVFRTHAVYWGVLHWWFLCSLQHQCIAPMAKGPCPNKQEVLFQDTFSGCHRFDQAAINLLTSHYYGYQYDSYILCRQPPFLFIEKQVTKYYSPAVCLW